MKMSHNKSYSYTEIQWSCFKCEKCKNNLAQLKKSGKLLPCAWCEGG